MFAIFLYRVLNRTIMDPRFCLNRIFNANSDTFIIGKTKHVTRF